MKKRIRCKGKKQYKYYEQAIYPLKLLRKKGYIACIYKCKKCGFYHVGKPSYYDSPRHFWHNIENKMREHEES